MSLNLDSLSKKFGKDFISLKQIYSGFDNDIFVVATSDKKYIYRRAHRNKPTEDILFEKNFSEYMHSKQIPVRSVLVSGSESLLGFCEGQTYSVQQITKKMAFNAGKMLAQFHNVAKEFDVPPFPKRKIDSELLRAISVKDKLKNKYTNGAEFTVIVEQLLQSDFLKAPMNCVIHNDFRVQNVLFLNDTISAILDFDWSCMGRPLKDLSHALVEWSLPDGGEFNPDIFNALFTGYKSVSDNINLDELRYWIDFSCISDTATYLCDTIDDASLGGNILSWMYGKYLFFNKYDINKLCR